MPNPTDTIELLRQQCAPSVWEADVDELIEGGWIDTPRCRIPANWRELANMTAAEKAQVSRKEAKRRYDAANRERINERERLRYAGKLPPRKGGRPRKYATKEERLAAHAAKMREQYAAQRGKKTDRKRGLAG